jgi:hypothetical protein
VEWNSSTTAKRPLAGPHTPFVTPQAESVEQGVLVHVFPGGQTWV